jgi:hypothetical protein
MLRRARIDPLGRQAAIAIAGGRIAIGVGALLATGPALKVLGFSETDVSGRALARLAGSRDVALGLLTILARDDPRGLRVATAASAALDAADALSFGIASADPSARRAGLLGFTSGSAAALSGLWAWRRLSRRRPASPRP